VGMVCEVGVVWMCGGREICGVGLFGSYLLIFLANIEHRKLRSC
jgi:hypothetical protein